MEEFALHLVQMNVHQEQKNVQALLHIEHAVIMMLTHALNGVQLHHAQVARPAQVEYVALRVQMSVHQEQKNAVLEQNTTESAGIMMLIHVLIGAISFHAVPEQNV